MFARDHLNYFADRRKMSSSKCPKLHGLDFTQPPPASPVAPSQDIPTILEGEVMDAYFESPRDNIEIEVPADVPKLQLAYNGLISPKEDDGTCSTLLESTNRFPSASTHTPFFSNTNSPTIPTSSAKSSAGTTSCSSATVDSTDCAIPTQYAHPKRSLKKLQKCKKDKDREILNLIRAWSNLPLEEKWQSLMEKYTELHEDSKKVSMKLYLTEKDLAVITKEKTAWQTEQQRLVMQRSRLEGVCRELQKQNKLIKEQSAVRIREEEERRKEVTSKFQGTLNEVSSIMAQNTDKNNKLRDDNIDITNKFKSLCEQFEKREEQMVRMGKQMDLEKQLADAHVSKVQYELQAERELWAREREIAQENMHNADEQIKALNTHVADLEKHLRVYTDKYTEFETTICKSNQVFDNYKREMNVLNKQMSKVDKDAKVWKSRCQKNSQAMIELSETNQLQEIILQKNDRRIEQLQNLARTLHAERAAYLALLRAHGVEPTITSIVIEDTKPHMPPPPAPVPEKSKKEQELQLLQKEMAILKRQLKHEEKRKSEHQTDSYDSRSCTSSPEVANIASDATPTKRRNRRRRNKNSESNDFPRTDGNLTETVESCRLIETIVIDNNREIVITDANADAALKALEDLTISAKSKARNRKGSLDSEEEIKKVVLTDVVLGGKPGTTRTFEIRKTVQSPTAADKPSLEKPAARKPSQDKPAAAKPSQNKPSAEKSSQEKPAADKPAQEKPSQDKPSAEKPPQEKPAADKPSQEKPSQDKPSAEKPSQEKPAADKPSQEEPVVEKSSQDKPSVEKPSAEKPSQDKPSQDKPSQEKPSQDVAYQDKPSEDKPSQEKPSQEQNKQEKLSKEQQNKQKKKKNNSGNGKKSSNQQQQQPNKNVYGNVRVIIEPDSDENGK